jgi:hypothetical protein
MYFYRFWGPCSWALRTRDGAVTWASATLSRTLSIGKRGWDVSWGVFCIVLPRPWGLTRLSCQMYMNPTIYRMCSLCPKLYRMCSLIMCSPCRGGAAKFICIYYRMCSLTMCSLCPGGAAKCICIKYSGSSLVSIHRLSSHVCHSPVFYFF